jgi:subtilisin family serine protease
MVYLASRSLVGSCLIAAASAFAHNAFSEPAAVEAVPGEFVVRLAAPLEQKIEALQAEVVHKSLNIYLMRATSTKELTTVLQAAGVQTLYSEPNFIYRTQTIPNDPRFAETYGLHNEGQNGGTADADIDAPEAWDTTTGTRAALVAVIDTGLDRTHPDLQDNAWINPGEDGLDDSGVSKQANGIDDDANGFIDDWQGWDFVNNDNDPMDDNRHGTHCAGTIAARGNNGDGVAGVAWDASLVGVKFLSGAGSGTLDDAVKAIDYATKIGARIMSNSWGGGGFSQALLDAIVASRDAGALFVAAAGNARNNNDATPSYPASYAVDNVVAVAATDRNDVIAGFSSFGALTVHLAAPGVDVVSTVPGNGYEPLSGTSMATPHVSGAAVIVWAAFPEATYAEVKSRLITTVDKIPALADKTFAGGRLNVAQAIEIDNTAPNAPSGIVQSGTGLVTAQIQWLAAGDDGAVGLASQYQLKISDLPILDEAGWEAAPDATARITSARGATTVTAEIANLATTWNGYVTIRAVDNIGNRGPISESAAIRTSRAVSQVLWTAATPGQISFVGWGIEQGTDGESMFSDSPTGPYVNNANSYLETELVAITSRDLVLRIDHMHELADAGDFGSVQVAFDGEVQWQELARVTGNGETPINLSLLGVIPDNARSIQFRLLFMSDFRGTAEGWRVKAIDLMRGE